MAKKLSIIIVIAILATMLILPTANANVQSRPEVDSLVSKTVSEFFLLCRQMETSGGPMGLNATITIKDEGKDTAEVEENLPSNNIDVHMAKNTEYGTAALLSASTYGSCPQGYKNLTIDSTTGNDSGVKQMAAGKYEYVAGIHNNPTTSNKTYRTYLLTADSSYKNVYDDSKIGIPGDATTETPKWRGAGLSDFVTSSGPVFVRSCSGVFNYYHVDGSYGNVGSRAAVVCGVGL